MNHSTLFSILGAACFVCVGACIFAPSGFLFTFGSTMGSFLGTMCLKFALNEKANESQPRG